MGLPQGIWEFQSLFYWNTSNEFIKPHEMIIVGWKFQSLFYWNILLNHALVSVSASDTDVSILVVVECLMRKMCVHGFGPEQRLFQSLFYWNTSENIRNSHGEHNQNAVQSLFYWNTSDESARRLFSVYNGEVSILVVVECPYEVIYKVDIHPRPRSFNPCCGGILLLSAALTPATSLG